MSKPSPAEAGQDAARKEVADRKLLAELKDLSEETAELRHRVGNLRDRLEARAADSDLIDEDAVEDAISGYRRLIQADQDLLDALATA